MYPSVVQRGLRQSFGNNDYIVYAYRSIPEVCGLFIRDLDPKRQHVVIYDETAPEIVPEQWERNSPGECMFTYIEQARKNGASFVVGLTKQPTMTDGFMVEAFEPGSDCFFFTMNASGFRRRRRDIAQDRHAKYPWCRLILETVRHIQKQRIAAYIKSHAADIKSAV